MPFIYRKLNQFEVEQLKRIDLSYANDIGLVREYDLDGVNFAAVDAERGLIAINVTRITAAHDDYKMKICALQHGNKVAYVWYHEDQFGKKEGDCFYMKNQFKFKKILPEDLTNSECRILLGYLEEAFTCFTGDFVDHFRKSNPQFKKVESLVQFEHVG